jgi:LPXTG-motif cell wall-anchored protein
MRKNDKKLTALILVVLLALFNLPFVSFAEVTVIDNPGQSALKKMYDEKSEDLNGVKTYTFTSTTSSLAYVIVHAGDGQTYYKFDESEYDENTQITVTFSNDRKTVTVTSDGHGLSWIGWKYNTTPTPTDVPTATPTDAPQATPTDTPVATPTDTPVATPTDTPVATPTDTPQATPTDTPQATPTDTPVATPTDTPQATPTDTPVATPTDRPERPDREPTPTDTPDEPFENILDGPQALSAPITEAIVEIDPPLALALPKTGEIPATLFYGIGGMLSTLGVFLRRKR